MRWTWLWAAPIVAAGVGWGCGGSLAAPDAGNNGQQDASITTEYRWGDVSVHVQPTGAVVGSMTVVVTDRATPATLSTTLMFDGSSPGPAIGAGSAAVTSLHGCTGDPSLQQISIYTCSESSAFQVTTPGCLGVRFSNIAAAGGFIHPSGARCDIVGASADIKLPRPSFNSGVPNEAASGTFLLECRGSDGTAVQLEGVFTLPQRVTFLAC